MHYHCEIILPPGAENIEEAVRSVMGPFSENLEGEEASKYSFWDWYVIGGRWAGTKCMAGYDSEKLKEFEEWLQAEHVTVSGLRAGKPELNPASQIEKVDAKWNEMFPSKENVMVACPMFNHSSDQYGRRGESVIDGDICPLSQAKEISCSRLIIAAPSYTPDSKERIGPLEAVFMLQDCLWNGVTHVDSKWDGTVKQALEIWNERSDRYNEQYLKCINLCDDSITVTVDYHT
jgi:hypothetical protein